MKRRLILIISLILALAITLGGCKAKGGSTQDLEKDLRERDEKIVKLEEEINELKFQLKDLNQGASDNNIPLRVMETIGSIKDKDWDKLSTYVHPTKGLRFSPYDYIDIEKGKAFTVEEVKALGENNEVYMWGNYDGTGEPIELSFNDYYNRFIYDADFANPQIIGNNVAVSQGNALSNINDVYPNSHFIEFHFKEIDPQYSGMDWRSLKLVFEEDDGIQYLVAIVHGEWTI